MDSIHPLQPTDPPVLPLSEHQPAAAADPEASRSRSRTHSEVSEAPTIQYTLIQLLIYHVNLDQRKLLFLNRLFLRQIRRREVLLSHRLSFTPTLPRHMDECMLNWVMNRTSCSGRIWVSIILCSGWTTLQEATTYHTLDMSYVGCSSLQAYILL